MKKIIDIGSGDGYLKNLLELYIKRAYWILLDRIRPNDKIIQYDFNYDVTLPVKSCSVDLVLSINSINYCEKPELLLKEVCRVLKPRGRVIILYPMFFLSNHKTKGFLKKPIELSGLRQLSYSTVGGDYFGYHYYDLEKI